MIIHFSREKGQTRGRLAGLIFPQQAGQLVGTSLEALIAQNSQTGLVWTDPEADTYICGHRGHFQTSCGLTFSHVINTFLSGGHYSGAGMGPGIM